MKRKTFGEGDTAAKAYRRQGDSRTGRRQEEAGGRKQEEATERTM